MTRIMLLLLLGARAWSATYSICNSGCTYAQAQLQTALDALSCGDTLVLTAAETYTYAGGYTFSKACSFTNPITITTSRAAFLPPSGARVTPSHAGNMPTIVLTAVGSPTPLYFVSGATPASGYILRGLRITSTAQIFDLLDFGYNASPRASSDAQTPNEIRVQHCWLHGNYANRDQNTQKAISSVARNIEILDSYLDELRYIDVDNQGFWQAYGAGPVLFRNNYVNTTSIPFLIGSVYETYDAGNRRITALVEHNYFYKSPKWFSASPTYQAGVTNPSTGAYCMKNGFEIKASSQNSIVRFNMIENGGDNCNGQSFGAVIGSSEFYPTGTGATVSGGGSTVTFPSTAACQNLSGPWVVLRLTISGTDEFRDVNTISCPVVTVTSPYSVTSGTYDWGDVEGPWRRVDTTFFENNYILNADRPIQMQSKDPGFSTARWPLGRRQQNLVVRNNLIVRNANLLYNSSNGRVFTAADSNGLTYRNNTFERVGVTLFGQYGVLLTENPIAGLIYENNLVRWQEGPFPGQIHSTNGNGSVVINDHVSATNSTLVRNNVQEGADQAQYEPCTAPRVCSGGFFPAVPMAPLYASSASYNFRLRNTSPYKRRGVDGSDVGVDYGNLPSVDNLLVDLGPSTLTFHYDLSPPLADRTCTLEVSTEAKMNTDRLETGIYTVVNSVNPVLTAGADNDAQSSKVTTRRNGTKRTWLVDGLSGGTTYYYRLQCGGITLRGSAATR